MVEKRVGRLTLGSVAFIRQAQAVQLKVDLLLRGQASAWWLSAQYGHITWVLHNFEVCQFMHNVLVTQPFSVFLL